MDEKEWLEKISHLSDKFEDLQDRLRELEITLHGKRSKTGLLAEYERHDELLARLYAVVWQDPTGQKGLLHDVDALMGRASERQKDRQARWQFWTAVTVAVIGLGATLLTNWEKILKSFPKSRPDPVEQMMEKIRHPKPRHRHYVIQRSPEDSADESEK